jgi:CRISPR-associated protein Cmx8
MNVDSKGLSPEASQRVYDIVRAYVYRRTEEKSSIAWDQIKGKKVKDPTSGRERIDYPKEYVEARQKVCRDAFLRLRSCKSREDFVAFFTATFCAVPQFLPPEEYRELSRMLLDTENWSDARALAMLALSGLANL